MDGVWTYLRPMDENWTGFASILVGYGMVLRVGPPLFLVGVFSVSWVAWRMYFYLGLVGDDECN
jgi:hypothetical protein